jgi:ABC-type branched-subunit amino acid transport system substrate-binding protein
MKVGALVVLTALAISACGSDDASTATTVAAPPVATDPPATDPPSTDAPPDPVKIGVVLSASGSVAQIGQAGIRALEGFQDCWTFKNGGKIEFEIVNDGSDPTQAVAAVDTLVEAGVVGMLGFSGGAIFAANARLIETQLPIIHIPPIPYPGYNTEPYLFGPNIPQVSTQLLDMKAYGETLGLTNMTVLTTDGAQGDAIKAISEAVGLVAQQVPIEVTNYQPILAELRDDGIDGLITLAPSGAPPAFISLGKAEIGWEVEQFMSPANLTEDYLELAGDAAEGGRGFVWPVGLGSAFFADNPEQAAAVAEVEKCLPGENFALNPTLGFYWDNALAFALAIDEVGSDPDAIRDQLENQEFYGAFGFNQRTPTDHDGYKVDNALFAILENGNTVPATDAQR